MLCTVTVYRLYHTHSLGSVEPTIALSESLWSRIVTILKNKKFSHVSSFVSHWLWSYRVLESAWLFIYAISIEIKRKSILSVCVLRYILFQSQGWFEFTLLWFEECWLYAKTFVVCFGFNMHNLWLLKFFIHITFVK